MVMFGTFLNRGINMNQIFSGYYTPITGSTDDIIIVGEPFEVWFEWEKKPNGKWKGNYYENNQSKISAKQNWMVPVVMDVGSIGNAGGLNKVLLWRVGKQTMASMTEIASDSAYGGNGMWDSLYKIAWRVKKVTDTNGNYPRPFLMPKPNPPTILPTPLNQIQQKTLIAEFWGKAQKKFDADGNEVVDIDGHQIEESPEVIEERARKEKVDKILKKMGYGSQNAS